MRSMCFLEDWYGGDGKFAGSNRSAIRVLGGESEVGPSSMSTVFEIASLVLFPFNDDAIEAASSATTC
jgi:hypothetical protein